jgi:isocitrate dehydrogenase
LLLAGVAMLVHIGQSAVAETVHNAWKRTIEEGIHTGDIFREGRSREKVGTNEFTDAVIERLGQKPERLRTISYGKSERTRTDSAMNAHAKLKKELYGVDVFLDWDEAGRDPDVLGAKIVSEVLPAEFNLTMITNRGLKVYPDVDVNSFKSDHWRCRFLSKTPIQHSQVVALLSKFSEAGLDFIKTEHLYYFDGKPGFSLGQGE